MKHSTKTIKLSNCQMTMITIGSVKIYCGVEEVWKALQNGWQPPTWVSKEEHKGIRLNKEKYPPELVGWVGFNCSYSGIWFGGFAGYRPAKPQYTNKITGEVNSYQAEAIRNVMKQIPLIREVVFHNKPFWELEIPNESIIFCDPPYEGTSKYKNVENFDHKDFWEWCRIMVEMNHKVFVSEYNAPEDFVSVWEKELSSQLSANGKSGGNKISIEKLFIHKSQL